MATKATKSTAVHESNVAVLDQSCKVGTVRYYQRNGRTYLRTVANRTSASSNPRSDKQMETRMKQKSLALFWNRVSKYLRGAFQHKEQNQSDYNAFVKYNMQHDTGCYVDKTAHSPIPMPVFLSVGNLVINEGGPGCPNIPLGDATDLSTVGKLSTAILANNPMFEEGDKITLLYGYNGAVIFNVAQIVLDSESTEENTLFTKASTGLLSAGDWGTYDYRCWIWSKPDGSVSTSYLMMGDGFAGGYEQKRTAAAFKSAKETYGASVQKFL